MNCITLDETCPYCGEEIEDIAQYFSDESDPKFECPHCGELIQGYETVAYSLEQVTTTARSNQKEVQYA